MQYISHNDIIPFAFGNFKICFQTSEYIIENLLQIMELFELRILESGNMDLKTHTFTFVMALLFFNVTLFLFLPIYTVV